MTSSFHRSISPPRTRDPGASSRQQRRRCDVRGCTTAPIKQPHARDIQHRRSNRSLPVVSIGYRDAILHIVSPRDESVAFESRTPVTPAGRIIGARRPPSTEWRKGTSVACPRASLECRRLCPNAFVYHLQKDCANFVSLCSFYSFC
ncbi:hypothetical protein EVAR_33206_1 [Eumeta japonica]|uniref:Uncharacterized protein n=1 Tax=Eumeta variegata TaxID=151549 RepID=A0A4C1W211_EUMVA|nr:hypothetical protein EVAR_33206_1 [Eumeta japonica]